MEIAGDGGMGEWGKGFLQLTVACIHPITRVSKKEWEEPSPKVYKAVVTMVTGIPYYLQKLLGDLLAKKFKQNF